MVVNYHHSPNNHYFRTTIERPNYKAIVRNYVVDAEKCNLCMACISPCPTGSIDNWRTMPKARAYSTAEQLEWDVLPDELSSSELADAGVAAQDTPAAQAAQSATAAATEQATTFNSAQYGASVPPWSAAHAFANLYGPKADEKTVTVHRLCDHSLRVGSFSADEYRSN